MSGRQLYQQLQQTLSPEQIILKHRLYRKHILLTAHMFVRREVCHYIKRTQRPENLLKHRIAKINRIGDEVVRHPLHRPTAQVTNQLCKTVLIYINYTNLCHRVA